MSGVLHPKVDGVRVAYYIAKPELKTCSGQHNLQNNTHLYNLLLLYSFWMANCPFTMFSEITI